MKKLSCYLFSVLICLSLCCCSKNESNDNGRIKIVASLFPQYDFACNIAGDKADVTMLLPYGADSHSFDPSMKDITAISDADLFIFTGENMEAWTASFIENMPGDCTILDVSGCVEKKSVFGQHTDHDDHDDHMSNVDPHIWTSPKNAVLIAISIATELSNLDPGNADYYAENLTRYISELSYLDENIRNVIDASPQKKLYFGGKFSFLYFVEEYGLSYMSLYDSCSESAEPSARKLNEMVDDMKKNDAKVIFYPELSEPKAALTIAQTVGAEAKLLHSCHNISSNEAKAGKTYISIMYENLENLKEALR